MEVSMLQSPKEVRLQEARQPVVEDSRLGEEKGLAAKAETNSLLRIRRSLVLADLRSLSCGEILLLVVKDYYEAQDAKKLADSLSNSGYWDTYPDAPGILRIGHALFDCQRKTACPEYFAQTENSRRALRQSLHPLANPSDLVVRDLDYVWPAGCRNMVVRRNKAFVGLVRGFERGGDTLPHVDRADWDLPSEETAALRAQFAINVALSTTELGGGLELWGYQPSLAYFRRTRLDYGFDRQQLPEPILKYLPEPGDFYIFNAWGIHAVTPSEGRGRRITVSGFLGYTGDDETLLAFS